MMILVTVEVEKFFVCLKVEVALSCLPAAPLPNKTDAGTGYEYSELQVQ
jgi:hypothetical protein